MQNSSKKKTWVKRKNAVYNCGNCDWCGKVLFSDMGSWIVNAEKKHFCHNSKDYLCFDQYIDSRKPISKRTGTSAA